MATVTFGTNATTTLTAMQWNASSAVADIAAIAANIKDDVNPAHPIWPGAFSKFGTLYVPNRGGFLLLKPGDWIAYGSTGFPIVLSAAAVTADWTHG